ncbi:hypothetical protein HMPREF9711_02828 [Myroides odoratimimus CCUG 3837]|uniref:hypothetical protein n=1 Tax=Myroides odoratimimus TaxID=76832 RepID=UPI000280A6FF|nr:hypothetical protein [Myroides odoratimimus]EKB03501.1 hypothetical protein HMPREF9711_02828 [Myroides odoratimimus CCUG 3837]
MGWFSNKSKFPKENKDRGIVRITDNKIIISNRSYESEDEIILIPKIEYIYLETSDYSEPSMFIYQDRQYYIPGDYAGTEKLWLYLAEQFHFDINLVTQHLNDKTNNIHKLYRTTYKQNYKLTNTSHNDYLKGYEILAPTPIFVPWNTTKEKLLAHEYIHSDGFYAETTYPVRIGNITVDNLGTYIDDVRSDVAPTSYYTKCFAPDGSDTSLYQLKEILEHDLGSTATYTFYNEHHLFFYAESDHITFELNYTIDDPEFRTVAYSFTSLNINTKYDYPDLLSDDIYAPKLVLSATYVFNYSLTAPSNYLRNERIKSTPDLVKLQSKNNSVIWIDKLNNRIGFADKAFSITFNKEEIDSLTLWNTLPAKGGGFCILSVNLKEGNAATVFEGAHDTIKHDLEDLEQFLGLQINFYEDYNC